jgi:hypothetical protein
LQPIESAPGKPDCTQDVRHRRFAKIIKNRTA